MPLFNPLFDEETKRRLALTPGINPKAPNPAGLPEINLPTPRPRPRILSIPGPMPGNPEPNPFPETAMPGGMPMATRGRPGILAGPDSPVEYSAPSRSARLESEKDAFMRTTPGRGRSILAGVIRGLATPGEGGLGGLIGRVAGGALAGGISPKSLRETEFNQRIKPQILERFAMEDQEQAGRIAAEDRQLNNAYRVAQIGAVNRSNQPQPTRLPAIMNTPGGALDTGTRTIIPGTGPQPRDEQSVYSSSPQGIFNRKTGQITTPAPEKESEPPAGAREALTELDNLRREAADLWGQWGTFEPTSDQREDTPELKMERQRAASEAQARYNQAAQRFDELYGKWFEVGGFTEPNGNQGWAYVKRRRGQSQGGESQPQQRKATADADFVNFVARKKGITPEKAKQLIQDDGYTVK